MREMRSFESGFCGLRDGAFADQLGGSRLGSPGPVPILKAGGGGRIHARRDWGRQDSSKNIQTHLHGQLVHPGERQRFQDSPRFLLAQREQVGLKLGIVEIKLNHQKPRSLEAQVMFKGLKIDAPGGSRMAAIARDLSCSAGFHAFMLLGCRGTQFGNRNCTWARIVTSPKLSGFTTFAKACRDALIG